MTVVENVLVGGVEASFYTVLHHLAGSGWTLQLLDLAGGQQRESKKAQFIKQTGKGHTTILETTQGLVDLLSATCDLKPQMGQFPQAQKSSDNKYLPTGPFEA